MSAAQFDALNTTELVAIAQQFSPEAHRGLPREVLLAILENAEELELPRRTINKKRLKIMKYINENWVAVEPLIACPARSRDPHACYRCSDLQVTSCTIDNSEKFAGED